MRAVSAQAATKEGNIKMPRGPVANLNNEIRLDKTNRSNYSAPPYSHAKNWARLPQLSSVGTFNCQTDQHSQYKSYRRLGV